MKTTTKWRYRGRGTFIWKRSNGMKNKIKGAKLNSVVKSYKRRRTAIWRTGCGGRCNFWSETAHSFVAIKGMAVYTENRNGKWLNTLTNRFPSFGTIRALALTLELNVHFCIFKLKKKTKQGKQNGPASDWNVRAWKMNFYRSFSFRRKKKKKKRFAFCLGCSGGF